jgi:competence protein CoiA
MIHAFDVGSDDWCKLETANRRSRHLRMPCCFAQVTLRRSRRGTQFFAHKAIGECTTAPETEAHLRLKQNAVEVARAHGWDAQTEVMGLSPAGESWTADVLANLGKHRVAIEVQWSAQTDEETSRRQARYAASGVRCLWLMRQRRVPLQEALPAARISGSGEIGFTAHVPTGHGEQTVPVEELLAAAFSKRLKFGIPPGVEGRVSIRTGRTSCWRCNHLTEIVTGIDIAIGPHRFEFTVPELTGHAGLHGSICREAGHITALSSVKVRKSNTQRRSYLSNGCSRCNALYGQFHEYDAWTDQRVAYEYPTQVDEHWMGIIRDQDDDDVIGWGVYDAVG